MAPLLQIDFADNASFKITVAGTSWFESSVLRAFANNKWHYNLTQTGVSHTDGADKLGKFSCTNITWVFSHSLVLHTSLKKYSGNTFVFVQQLPQGAQRTNASNPILPGALLLDPGNYPPVISFPSFSGGQLQKLGYLTWQSRMVNAEWGVNVTSGPPGTNEPLIKGRGLQGLSTNGPIVLYNHDFDSLVVAPIDNFKSAVHYANGAAWETGR